MHPEVSVLEEGISVCVPGNLAGRSNVSCRQDLRVVEVGRKLWASRQRKLHSFGILPSQLVLVYCPDLPCLI